MSATILAFCLFGQALAQGAPGNAPDSLFKGVDLDTLPLPLVAKERLNELGNKPYTKGMRPVQVKNIGENLLRRPQVELRIPGKITLPFRQDHIRWHDSTNYVWYGVSTDSVYRLKLVKNKDQITGTFSSDTASYRIRPIHNFFPGATSRKVNLHVITRIDASEINLTDSLRQRSNAVPARKKRSHPESAVVTSDHSATNQGIMVVYTNRVTQEVADPHALAQSAVNDANSAYENSGVGVHLNLVHSAELDYDGSGDTDTDLQRLQDSTDNYIDQVHEWRDQYGADIVVLLTASTQSDESGTVTGEAYEIMADSTTAFAVVRYDFAESPIYTLAHEVGHLQGADHNPADEINPYQPYGHGYVNKSESWRTIMSYNIDGCCSRIEFFSTPHVTYNGDPLGTDSEHDNARLITETATTIADFRPPYPLDAEVSGPSYVQQGNSGTWEAMVSGGQSPYTYRWSRSYSQDGNWNMVSQSSSFTVDAVDDDFALKLEVTDDTGTDRETVFRVFTDVKSSVPDPANHPSAYLLSSNYPNPFNPSTRFSYQLPEASYVTIEVYSVTGQLVSVLKDGYQNSGSYKLTFNGRNLSSGIYLLRMNAEARNSADHYTETVKMLLMK